MTGQGATGLWELFTSDLPKRTFYKYEIRSKNQETPFLKAAPYAFAEELRPQTGSIVRDLSTYRWNDRFWMQERTGRDPLPAPMSIYEVHLGFWMRARKEAAGG